MGKLYKQKGQSNYTQVPNSLITSGASLRAIGLWARLAQLPDKWDFSIAGIATILTEGKDTVRTTVSELETLGFLTRLRIRQNDGKLAGSDWQINWNNPKQPSEKPTTAKPTLVEPTLVKPTQYKKELIKDTKNIILKETLSKDNGQEPLEYGNQDINELFKDFEEATGLAITAKIQQNRRFAKTLIARHGKHPIQQTIKLLAVAHNDQYAPRIKDFVDLHYKWGDLAIWFKTKYNKKTNSNRVVDLTDPSKQGDTMEVDGRVVKVRRLVK